MTFIGQSGSDLPDNLPLLTRVVDENFPDDLPTLTEVVQENIATDIAIPPPSAFGDEEMRRLLLRLEAHLETVFAEKLNLRLEQLQQVAVEQAVNELKAELPNMLRNALNTRTEL
ncbi:MAG: hypothetical protein EPN14_06025 [Gallionella sp.]|nr:MAG: hypothetical protein EPN14_06025 [Gallionella sp.]